MPAFLVDIKYNKQARERAMVFIYMMILSWWYGTHLQKYPTEI